MDTLCSMLSCYRGSRDLGADFFFFFLGYDQELTLAHKCLVCEALTCEEEVSHSMRWRHRGHHSEGEGGLAEEVTYLGNVD